MVENETVEVVLDGVDGQDGDDGDDAVVFWADLSTPIHTGRFQRADTV